MSRRNKGRIGGPFVPLLKDTMKTEAWKALSHGARSLYGALKGRYNSNLQNAVYLSIRVAQKELGSFSRRDNIGRWFHELQYYGFIVMESGACLGVEGRGKAPHYRLTEQWYLGKAPTRDFLNWDGEVFNEQKSPRFYTRKKQNPVPAGEDSLSRQVGTVERPLKPNGHETVPTGEAIHHKGTIPHGEAITSLTTPCADAEPVAAYSAACDAPLVPVAGALTETNGIKISPNALTDDWDGLLPDQKTVAAYIAAWENSALGLDEYDLRGMPQDMSWYYKLTALA